ncbi:MAG: hypothetical protein QG604_537 [Candidatus Dependentiae bacterium]|nr:hypothetical protein [Candidatus Dependentiae bacterium]
MKKMLQTCIVTLIIGLALGSNVLATAFNGSADFELVDGNVLTMNSGTISLTGDRVISLVGDAATAIVKIGATPSSGAVTIQPGSEVDSILLFDVFSAGSVLEVQVLNDLIFQSSGADATYRPLYIGVRGKGEVRFRLPCGKNITLNGAHLRILMEQTLAQMQASSQLSFVRWSLSADTDHGVNLDPSLHSVIEVGQNSSVSFISQHKSGLVDDSGALDYGYGSLLFDPSNNSTGRMILKITAGSEAADFTDGSFMIYGSYVEPTGLGSAEVVTSDMRTNVVYKYRAGIAAAVRISDALARSGYEPDSDELSAFLSEPTNSRGLVVLNYNNSFPRLANNYDQTIAQFSGDLSSLEGGLITSKWFAANTVQNGFVLGNNGILEIENNRFLDYFACRVNTALENFPKDGVHVVTSATTGDGTHASDKVKQHNSSAFIIDGNAFRKTNTTAAQDPAFEYDATDVAQIFLRGNAGIYARVAADSVSGVLTVGTTDEAGVGLTIGTDGLRDAGFSGTYIGGTIGQASYDGFSVMMLDDFGDIVPEISLIGEIAIDVEGQVSIISTTTFDEVIAPNGYINMPSIMIDHRGQEIAYSEDYHGLRSGFGRALPLEGYQFLRYNNSQLLVNDAMTLNQVRLVHNDVGRNVALIGTGDAYPAIVGGELPSLMISKRLAEDPAYWVLDYTGSPIYLVNSTIECHESLVSAGVHWVVRDSVIDYEGGVTDGLTDDQIRVLGDNTSHLIMYNRGSEYDLTLSGMGRYFQLGSRLNTMADGETLDPLSIGDGVYPQSSLRDAFVDVYRQNPMPAPLIITGDETNTIKFSVETAHEASTVSDKAIQAIHISDRSQINVGWPSGQYQSIDVIESVPTSVTHLRVDSTFAAWEFSDEVLQAVIVDNPEDVTSFIPYLNGGGILEFAGDDIYVGGAGRYNPKGVITPAANELIPRGVRDSGGIVYANFGGTITASGSHDMILDTVMGRRTCAIQAGAGLVTIPEDQFIFQSHGRVETFGFDPVANETPHLVNQFGNNPIVSINVNELPTPGGFEPIKGIDRRSPSFHWPHTRRLHTRSTDSVTLPVTMPSSGMLVMTSGDTVEQLLVFGATRANPFHLWLSGDGVGFSRIREFVSMTSDPVVLGEGPYAALFLDHGARIGLGNRAWNANSINAWNQLGLDKVTLYPNGNGVVDLNSDIIITDKLPIIATENFGNGATAHQLIFYSDVPREIRILSGGELDLSSFGRGAAAFQQIVFSGYTKLVLEPGAKIRFPSTVTSDNHACGPVLYFNDNSQCVFMSNQQADASRWIWSSDAPVQAFDKVRSKILGIGQIWLNKQATLTIYDNALVGIEADYQTPTTDVTISIQRQAKMLIGDANRSGGAFQVGNILDGGGDGTNSRDVVGAHPTDISFSLTLNGDTAMCHIDRSGFMGLAAGVVNKVGNPNGTLPSSTTAFSTDLSGNQYNAWQVQSLWNVKNIALNITSGFFDHNQIFDGSASAKYGSVLAIGPLDYNADDEADAINGGSYTLTIGDPSQAFIRGGGNVVYVDAGIPQDDPLPLSIWNTSTYLTGTDDSGKYTILAPSLMVYSYTTPTGSPLNPTGTETISVTNDSSGNPIHYSFQSSVVDGAAGGPETQGAALIELYNILSMPIYGGYPEKFVPAGKIAGGVAAAYLTVNVDLTSALIVRTPVTVAKDKFGNGISPLLSLDGGYFIGTTPGGSLKSGAPEAFCIA